MCARDERTVLKTSGTDVLSSRKKLRKALWGRGGGGGIQPPPLYVQGLNDPRKKQALIIVGKTACQKEN